MQFRDISLNIKLSPDCKSKLYLHNLFYTFETFETLAVGHVLLHYHYLHGKAISSVQYYTKCVYIYEPLPGDHELGMIMLCCIISPSQSPNSMQQPSPHPRTNLNVVVAWLWSMYKTQEPF